MTGKPRLGLRLSGHLALSSRHGLGCRGVSLGSPGLEHATRCKSADMTSKLCTQLRTDVCSGVAERHTKGALSLRHDWHATLKTQGFSIVLVRGRDFS